jgi:hypothetical protein
MPTYFMVLFVGSKCRLRVLIFWEDATVKVLAFHHSRIPPRGCCQLQIDTRRLAFAFDESLRRPPCGLNYFLAFLSTSRTMLPSPSNNIRVKMVFASIEDYDRYNAFLFLIIILLPMLLQLIRRVSINTLKWTHRWL